ncbi:MAG: protein kinase, partial [Planctomycetes bacterium]|nr:protein kinase [Planctomycetota bacterium]
MDSAKTIELAETLASEIIALNDLPPRTERERLSHAIRGTLDSGALTTVELEWVDAQRARWGEATRLVDLPVTARVHSALSSVSTRVPPGVRLPRVVVLRRDSGRLSTRLALERPAELDASLAQLAAPPEGSERPSTLVLGTAPSLSALEEAIRADTRHSSLTLARVSDTTLLSRALDPDGRCEEDLVGKVLDDQYLIVREIGRGGFSRVYEAISHPDDLRIPVAIKVLLPDAARTDEDLLAFKAEFQRLTRIQHENIVDWKVFRETSEGFCYLVMELLEGEELDTVLRRWKQLPPERVLPILRQILSALRAAHEGGVLHLDLKPKNIFVSPPTGSQPERVKVFDFGIGQYLGGEEVSFGNGRPSTLGASTLRSSRSSAGACTPEYASPEQCSHLLDDVDPEPLDERSDLYSLGIIVHQMLTGELPFDRPAVRTGWLRIHRERLPRRLAVPDLRIPRVLRVFVERSLRKDPKARWSSTEEAFRYVESAARSSARSTFTKIAASLVILAAILIATTRWSRPTARPIALVDEAGPVHVLALAPDTPKSIRFGAGEPLGREVRWIDAETQKPVPELHARVDDDGRVEIRCEPTRVAAVHRVELVADMAGELRKSPVLVVQVLPPLEKTVDETSLEIGGQSHGEFSHLDPHDARLRVRIAPSLRTVPGSIAAIELRDTEGRIWPFDPTGDDWSLELEPWLGTRTGTISPFEITLRDKVGRTFEWTFPDRPFALLAPLDVECVELLDRDGDPIDAVSPRSQPRLRASIPPSDRLLTVSAESAIDGAPRSWLSSDRTYRAEELADGIPLRIPLALAKHRVPREIPLEVTIRSADGLFADPDRQRFAAILPLRYEPSSIRLKGNWLVREGARPAIALAPGANPDRERFAIAADQATLVVEGGADPYSLVVDGQRYAVPTRSTLEIPLTVPTSRSFTLLATRGEASEESEDRDTFEIVVDRSEPQFRWDPESPPNRLGTLIVDPEEDPALVDQPFSLTIENERGDACTPWFIAPADAESLAAGRHEIVLRDDAPLPDGRYDFRVRLTDAVGNSRNVVRSVIVSREAPRDVRVDLRALSADRTWQSVAESWSLDIAVDSANLERVTCRVETPDGAEVREAELPAADSGRGRVHFEFDHRWSEREIDIVVVARNVGGLEETVVRTAKLPAIEKRYPRIVQHVTGRRMRFVRGGRYQVGGRVDELGSEKLFGPLASEWGLVVKDGDRDRGPIELPSYYLDETEVSNAAYERVLDSDAPESSRSAVAARGELPRVDVSLNDALRYADRLRVRLPSRA